MLPAIFHSREAFNAAQGRVFGPTEWLRVEQTRIDLFAAATNDHQWIHSDPERAARGPFGDTIAHGFLTLSLVNYFLPMLIEARGITFGVNYGTERVRFPAPVLRGARVRGLAQVLDCLDLQGGLQVTIRVTVELEGSAKPACVVDTLSRFYFADASSM